MKLSLKIIEWYHKNRRDLPWRNIKNPYLIWLSEIILQQTRVNQGLQYYKNFCHRYPNIENLAEAKEEEVMKLWQGLGYYSRARNLHKTAKIIVNEYQGNFPDDFLELKSLPGIGHYTASAIASMAFNKKYPVIDGNVQRVLSRLLSIKDPVDTSLGQKKILNAAYQLIDPKSPGTYNQAIMELGALICKPAKPLCGQCPVKKDCIAKREGNPESYPLKSKTVRKRIRHFHYLFFRIGDENNLNTLIHKRTGKDIWRNLYDFPLIESVTPLDKKELINSNQFKRFIGNYRYELEDISELVIHKLTHQDIHTRFFIIRIKDLLRLQHYLLVPLNSLYDYPISKLAENFLRNSGIKIK